MAKADLILVESNRTAPRVALAAAVLAALVFGWIAARGQFGDMIAEFTIPGEPSSAQMADIAQGMAPSNPSTMWLKASIEKNTFTPEKTESSLRMFEQTVKMSPRDFRWWIEFGRANEQSGNAVQAEASLKQAVALAPTYTFPRWQLGNFYLRQGRRDEAFTELKLATENNQMYREQVFLLAWEYFDHDPVRIEQIVADKPDVHASLAMFYAQRGLAADSLRNWNALNDAQKAEYSQFSKAIAQGLYDRRAFPQALEFARQIGMDPDAKPETVTNAGFEKLLGSAADTKFGWIVLRNDAKLEIATDSAVHHEGTKSVRLQFKGYNKPELYALGQNVVVEPGRSYKLHFWLRTENLRSAGMPQLQIVNGVDDKIITLSPAFPTGTNDWQQITIDFTAPAECSGIVIRTVRGFCGQDCPITGIVWYDEFDLKRVN